MLFEVPPERVVRRQRRQCDRPVLDAQVGERLGGQALAIELRARLGDQAVPVRASAVAGDGQPQGQRQAA